MKKKLKITVLVDEVEIPENDPQFENPPKEAVTEYHVTGALRTLGHDVTVMGAIEDIAQLAANLTGHRPQLVFNLTEHYAGNRQFDKNIAGLLEMLNIPFTGTGPTGLLLCRDKRLCKQLLSLHKIRVPGFTTFQPDKKIHVPKNLNFPLVIKPAMEDGSEGIAKASLVTNENALKDRVQFVHEGWRQPAIAEEYIEGKELYVTILGNKKLTVFPIRQVFFSSVENDGPQMLTFRAKWSNRYREKWGITFGFAELETSVVKDIDRICKKVYRIMQIHDYGRIDLRLTEDNKVTIIEANPNPDIAFGEEVAEAAHAGGMEYEQMIERIVKLALQRYR